jgi:acyl dehydratase
MSDAHFQRTITQEDMTNFAGLRSRRLGHAPARSLGSHHTDPKVAQKAGLSGTVAQALHYCAYVGQLLLQEHGQQWLEGGELKMKFIRPCYAGDTVDVKLVEGGVEVRNQRDELIAFGSVTLAGAE